MVKDKKKNRTRSLALYAVLYTTLSFCALITLVPFLYLFCASLKPTEVFFDDLFLPTNGLFRIDPATGELGLADTTHLDGGGTFTYQLTIQSYHRETDQVLEEALVLAQITAVHDPEDDKYYYTTSFSNAQNGSDVIFTKPMPDNEAVDQAQAKPVNYRISQGNPRGFMGIAWGLISLKHFDRLLTDEGFGRPILNSIFYASVSGVLATLFSAMSGYALAKYRFKGRRLITNLVLIALVVPFALLLAPNYQLLYWFGMLDNYSGLIIPGLAPAFGVYLFRQATINSVPNEMLESARIDGCGEIKIFFTFVLPMVRPMAGAFLLLTFLASWNNFIGAQIILQTPEKMPLAVAINQLRGVYGTDYGLIMAGTVVSIVPVLALFLLLQKEFLSGLTAGAVKG